MNFELSDDQKMLVDTAASFVKKDSPVDRMRALRDDDRGYDPKIWKQMGELGWLGIPFPEKLGGFGGQFLDVALVLEQFGTTLVPEPYLSSVVLGGMSILHAGDDTQKKRWLTPMIEGDRTLALAYAERGSRYNLTAIATQAEQTGDEYTLNGEKVFVLDGHAADHIVVSALVQESADRELGLFVIDARTDGVARVPIKTMDGRHAAHITLSNVRVPGDARLLAPDSSALGVLELVMDLGAAAACAEGLGIARRVHDMTVEYLGTREQFGAKIGTFQALQHRSVDMFIEVELCRSMMFLAAIEVGNPDVEARAAAVSAAKAQLATGGRFVARQGIQLHGGIGCTDEHDVGLYFKRMQVLGALFGDEEFHVTRFAHLPGFSKDAA